MSELCNNCGKMFEEDILAGGICYNCFELAKDNQKEQDYEELTPAYFSEDIKKYEKLVEEDPKDPMNYYYLAKEYMLKVPLRAINSLGEIEDLLRKSFELASNLWAPKIFLGELLFKQKRFSEAEKYFREVIEEKPESVSVKEYLAKCIENKKDNYSEKDLWYLFENDLRKFIKKVLEENFNDNWWRRGISAKIRASCMARREEGLEEEKDLDPILFASFFDYKDILQQNKALFSQYLNVKEWSTRLNDLEPIRNVIAHNRDLENAFEKIKDCYEELRRVLEKEK